ncbi:hypothetical protein CYMTET_24047 [Cymbomonas tetramitiformis]|uniref:Endonuclease/exonuclease/phosphatase domain-containing protein n=1 Tax=Cymbomonas tetramitiformis TaxID=36881 RepID=A0AAE0L0H0_9CHLO|nr:hypothetical protein CYMTET_27387 [Cymbomonas tetramitiformis]KAK3267392.1 hypothetical protein CYMTET_24047 [Cymbomonas tetramitiformis]
MNLGSNDARVQNIPGLGESQVRHAFGKTPAPIRSQGRIIVVQEGGERSKVARGPTGGSLALVGPSCDLGPLPSFLDNYDAPLGPDRGGSLPESVSYLALPKAGDVLDSGVVAAKVHMDALEGHNMALKPSSCVRGWGCICGYTGGTALWGSPEERDREKELVDAVTSEVQRAEMDGHLLVVGGDFNAVADPSLDSVNTSAVRRENSLLTAADIQQ